MFHPDEVMSMLDIIKARTDIAEVPPEIRSDFASEKLDVQCTMDREPRKWVISRM